MIIKAKLWSYLYRLNYQKANNYHELTPIPVWNSKWQNIRISLNWGVGAWMFKHEFIFCKNDDKQIGNFQPAHEQQDVHDCDVLKNSNLLHPGSCVISDLFTMHGHKR